LRPPVAGYLSMETPAGGWGTYFSTPTMTPVREYEFVDSARRYEVGGTANYPGAIGLTASLRMINQLGPAVIAEHVLRLTQHLIDGLRSLGVQVVTPPEAEHRSGIIAFSVGSAEDNTDLMERLLDEEILVSVRYTSLVGGVRVSCHFFNTLEDVDRLLAATGAWLRRR
jgi:cysteine desulfurase/selenocysteine lyase